jgi:hypothetical protein
MPGFDNNTVYAGNVDFSGAANVTPQVTVDGQILIGAAVAPKIRVANIAHADGSITVTNGAGTIDLSGTQSTTAQKGSVTLASAAETLIATDASKVITPATLNSMMSQSDLTGFVSWGGAGAYYDDTTLGTFQLLRGGTGYIRSKLITWVAQSVAGMTAGNTYYIYIDSTGTIGKSSARTDALFLDNIVLFECLRDSTPVTNNQVTVKENHPYDYPATVSNYEHDNIGTLVENNNNGANITLNGTVKIQINGADVLSDHGIETTIPDSGGAAVSWNKKYTTGAGKWALQNISDTFSGFYNNAGTPTALGAGKFGVYTLYVSKDNINASTPTYFTVLDTTQYSNLTAANTAISNGSTARASNELAQLELCQLGYIVFSQNTGTIVQVTISKTTLKQTLSTSGANTAALINTNVTNFNGWLSSADTTVQSALDTLDDSQRFIEVTGASANLAINQGVIANRGSLVSLTLPTTAKIGDTFEVVGKGAGGWSILQNANQMIHFINKTTTTGAGGSLSSSLQYDAVRFVCTVANLEFTVLSSCGNLTYV